MIFSFLGEVQSGIWNFYETIIFRCFKHYILTKTLKSKKFRMAQEKIEFSDLISISGSLGKFSPSGQFFALVYANKVKITSPHSKAYYLLFRSLSEKVKPWKISQFSQLWIKFNFLNGVQIQRWFWPGCHREIEYKFLN